MSDRYEGIRFLVGVAEGVAAKVTVKAVDLRALMDERDALLEALRPFSEKCDLHIGHFHRAERVVARAEGNREDTHNA